MNIPSSSPKPEIKFPAEWEFRIIVMGDQSEKTVSGLQDVFRRFGEDPAIERRETSKQGKYQALCAKMTMPDRSTLDAISRELAAVPGVKMIL
ncbi:MAG: DUF493 domain-containing protein [Victivallaceae bacterium]|nr:DUF493 domain-containing protein [Victivallaceae bacterium]